jgi:hypothetical protein
MTPEEASAFFREKDKDRDGYITVDEYMGKGSRRRSSAAAWMVYIANSILLPEWTGQIDL